MKTLGNFSCTAQAIRLVASTWSWRVDRTECPWVGEKQAPLNMVPSNIRNAAESSASLRRRFTVSSTYGREAPQRECSILVPSRLTLSISSGYDDGSHHPESGVWRDNRRP